MKSLESLKSIFKDRIFKIPDYQRGYAWQKKQLIEFWEDVINLPIDRFHYTGLLSLREVSKEEYLKESWVAEKWLVEDKGHKPFHIVDGQQRLTTMIIFINEIVDFISKLPSNNGKNDSDIYLGAFSLREIKEEYLVIKKPPELIFSSYKFGYEIDNPSFEYLKCKIFQYEEGGSIEETFYTLNLENAKQFLKDNIDNYYRKVGIKGLEELFKKTTQNLMFNLHEIEADFDVYVAFETMNNRGKKLSNLELLKNRLIYLTTLYDENEIKEDTRSLLRANINEAWKEVYMQLGRNKNKLLSDDDYLQAHWIMYFQYKRKRGDDYITYLLEEKFNPKNIYIKEDIVISSLENITEVRESETEESLEENLDTETVIQSAKLTAKEIFEYVQSLKITAKHWYNSFNPLTINELSNDEKLWLDRLNRIKIAYFRPLVVASFVNKDITTEDRIKLFKEIERFIFIAFRLGRAMATYRSSEYYIYARKLMVNDISIDEICNTLDKRIEEWLMPKAGFDIQPFKVAMSKPFKDGGGFYWWNGLQYFLYEYEHDKVLKNGNQKIDWTLFTRSVKDKVSIEHIYPQTPTEQSWKVSFDRFSNIEKTKLTATLGNLLPLSMSKNSSMQNDSFDKKKQNDSKKHTGYIDGSHSEIEVAQYTKWEADEILDRGLKLLEFMEERWDINFKSLDDKKEFLFLEFL